MTKIVSGKRAVALVCAAQVLVQIGASFWPALVPEMLREWQLSYSEAGWITSVFFLAYMLSVPVLVTATDRFDPRQVYLLGVALTVVGHLLFATAASGFWTALACRALTGVGWAGTYMTGLKLLADHVEPKLMSRATAGHAASVGLSGALSFACADFLYGMLGWQGAFLIAACSAATAWILVLSAVPSSELHVPIASGHFNFRPVFRNRSAMAYAIGYCSHTLEFHALRGWGVAFLAFVAARTGTDSTIVSPTTALTALGIIATFASVIGNEGSIRFGRRRFISLIMIASAICALVLAFAGAQSYWLAVAILLAYGLVISADSSSLTAGTAGSADPSRRGATLAIHSMLGYGGGFVGPLVVGWTLDLSGGDTVAGWTASYSVVAILVVTGLLAFRLMQPQDLTHDRPSRTQ